MCKPISAVDSGLEASITGPNDKAITVKNAKIVVESQHEDKIQLRVDLAGDETQKVFDKVLANLARSAPPIPGFRRTKGGKTSKVRLFPFPFFLLKLVDKCLISLEYLSFISPLFYFFNMSVISREHEKTQHNMN